MRASPNASSAISSRYATREIKMCIRDRPQLSQPVLRAATQSSPLQVQQPTSGPPQSVPAQTGSQQIAPPTPTHVGPVIVLDPAHGGIDNGARGQSGVVEKDLVLLFARTARLALEREGFRVVMTRNDDSDPSFDDRAALANSCLLYTSRCV